MKIMNDTYPMGKFSRLNVSYFDIALEVRCIIIEVVPRRCSNTKILGCYKDRV